MEFWSGFTLGLFVGEFLAGILLTMIFHKKNYGNWLPENRVFDFITKLKKKI